VTNSKIEKKNGFFQNERNLEDSYQIKSQTNLSHGVSVMKCNTLSYHKRNAWELRGSTPTTPKTLNFYFDNSNSSNVPNIQNVIRGSNLHKIK
jgi:hypothetical protein